VSSVLAHYTVTPEMRGGTGSASGSATGTASDDQLPDLSKGDRPSSAARRFTAAQTLTTPSSDSTVNQSSAQQSSTPNTSASFIGLQGSNITCPYFPHGCNPPDMGLAASPAFVFQGANTSFQVLSPSGKVQPGWPVNSQQFFQVPNEPNNCDPGSHNQPFTSDPRAIYDPVDGRFWAAILQVEGAPGFGVAPNCPLKTVYFIAVSQTRDPSGNWNVYEFEMGLGTGLAADFTQMGLNANAVFFSGNMFSASNGSFGYAEIFEANKARMERGEAGFTADGFVNLQGTGPGTTAQTGPFLADTVQPTLDLSDNAQGQNNPSGGQDGWFVDTIDGPDLINGHLCSSAANACKGLALWRMGNPVGHDNGGPAPTLTGTYLPDTKSFYLAPFPSGGFRSGADQPGCKLCVDANDLRIPAIPVLKDGTIYTGWGTGVFNGTQVVPGIVSAQINLGDGNNGVATTTSYFNFSGDDAATYPAYMPDGNGNVVMLYEHMGATTNPEVRYTVKGVDQSNFTSAGRVLRKGDAPYRPGLCGVTIKPCRWGDYEATSFDGTGSIWMAGEYTNTNTVPLVGPAFGRNWGTWMGAITTGG
jgi:hypothetical protein